MTTHKRFNWLIIPGLPPTVLLTVSAAPTPAGSESPDAPNAIHPFQDNVPGIHTEYPDLAPQQTVACATFGRVDLWAPTAWAVPDDTASFSLTFRDDDAGLLYIALANDESVSGSSLLATVRMRLASEAPIVASAPLALAVARLNDLAGRDFATSALQHRVGRRSGQLNIKLSQIYLPVVLRNP
jgi:hypothetical protein